MQISSIITKKLIFFKVPTRPTCCIQFPFHKHSQKYYFTRLNWFLFFLLPTLFFSFQNKIPHSFPTMNITSIFSFFSLFLLFSSFLQFNIQIRRWNIREQILLKSRDLVPHYNFYRASNRESKRIKQFTNLMRGSKNIVRLIKFVMGMKTSNTPNRKMHAIKWRKVIHEFNQFFFVTLIF